MASFLDNLYHLLSSPFSRSPLPPHPHSFLEHSDFAAMPEHQYTSLTSPSVESAISDSGDSGYFPAASSSRHRDSTSTTSSELPAHRPFHASRTITAPAPTPSLVSTQPSPPKLDAMHRHFPKPTRELSLDEMLALPPQKWSLGHYVKHARDSKAPAIDKEKQARDFENAKKELLRAREELKQLGTKP